MKKFIAMITALCCVVTQLFCATVFAETPGDYKSAFDTMTALGIFDSAVTADASVSRAQFAQILDRILSLSSKTPSRNLFGKDGDRDSFDDVADSAYADVAAESEHYTAVKAVSDYGLMSGADGMFYPDRALRYEEALKIFAVACGYNEEAIVRGGWTSGYYHVAQKMKITLGGKSLGTPVNGGELAAMLENVFDVRVKKLDSIQNDTLYFSGANDTFLKEYMNMDYAEGIMTASENSYLTMAKPSVDGVITVDGVNITNNGRWVNEFLGRKVRAYYADDSVKKLKYITLSSDDDFLTIAAADINSVSGGVIRYDDNGRERSVSINNYPVIYNNAAVVSYSDSIFDIESGDITVTDNGGDDVVIVRSFRSGMISSVEANSQSVYFEDGGGLCLDDSRYAVRIVGADGGEISFDKLVGDAVVSAQEGSNSRVVYVCAAPKKGVLESFSADDRVIELSQKSYKLTDSCAGSDFSQLLTCNVKVYIDKFGYVFSIKADGPYSNKNGLLAGISYGGSALSDGMVKIFSPDGNFEQYDLAKKIKLYKADSTDYVNISASKLDDIDALNGYRGYISYSVTNDGKVSEIKMPLLKKSLKQESDGRTVLKNVNIGVPNGFNSTTKSIGNDIFFDASVKVYSMPSRAESYDDYLMADYNLFANYMNFGGKVAAYFEDLDDPIPDALVITDYSPETQLFTLGHICVVKELRRGLNEKGENITTAVLVKPDGSIATVYSGEIAENSNGASCTLFDAASDFTGAKIKVDAGDLIMYNTKISSDELISIRLVYDCDKQNMSGGKKGYLSASVAGSDMYYVKNSLVDVAAEWNEDKYFTATDMISSKMDATGNVLTNQNPIRVESGSIVNDEPIERFQYNAHRFQNGGRQYTLGYAAHKADAFVYITTQDLSVPGVNYCENGLPDAQIPCPSVTDPEEYTGIYYQQYCRYVINGANILLIEYYDNGINVRKATPDDIYTYEQAGSEASRILSDVTAKKYYIINDYRSR